MISTTSPTRALSANATPFAASALCLGKRISRKQNTREQLRAAIGRVRKVAHSISDIERTDVPCRGRGVRVSTTGQRRCETHTSASLKTLQAAFLQQVVAELTKSKCIFVVTEVRSPL